MTTTALGTEDRVSPGRVSRRLRRFFPWVAALLCLLSGCDDGEHLGGNPERVDVIVNVVTDRPQVFLTAGGSTSVMVDLQTNNTQGFPMPASVS